MRLFHFLIAVSASLMLTACLTSQTTTVSKNPVAVPTELVARVNTDTTSTVSQTNQQVAIFNQLSDIDRKINIGAYTIAQQRLDQISSISSNEPIININWTMLEAKLQLLTGNPQHALTYLNQIQTSTELSANQKNYLMQLRSQALYRTNHILQSALTDAENHASNQTIWNKLLLVDPNTIQTSQGDFLRSGWLNLANIAQKNANTFAALKNNLITWQQNYPEHPANGLFATPTIVEPIQHQSIAVILPLSGTYKKLGEAIQQGMLNAYYASGAKTKQKMTFYDANSTDISTIYQQIKKEKNDIILGPLTKENTENLLKIADNSPRIISLNYTDTAVQSPHLEFGLSPTDEARQIAELAWRQGKSSAIIITPKTDKGIESADAFIHAWNNLGGQTVDRYNYQNSDDFSQSISSLLGATDSQWRQHILRDNLKTHFNSNGYFRKDADMVFLVADANIARKIRPFIKFYAGNALSVFSPASVYNGYADVNGNKDLNDVYFCDMPEILNPNHAQQQNRMFFLGQDAYLLAMQQAHLNTLPLFPLAGATGQLTVDPMSHIIQRELTCAQFKDGRATPVA